MIHAYPETYVNRAMSLIGDMVDYAINDCGMNAKTFYSLFTASSVCSAIEHGNMKYIQGSSGIEIAREVVKEMLGRELTASAREQYDRSAEYWAGWSLAYYQWFSTRRFAEIDGVIPFESVVALYNPLHEADISKFVSVIDEGMKKAYPHTRLKMIREAYGISQSKLAELSGVGLRSIQMYEQRNKNINKAGADILKQLSVTLGCSMEDLLEPNFADEDQI